jgi:hypothetical protein
MPVAADGELRVALTVLEAVEVVLDLARGAIPSVRCCHD